MEPFRYHVYICDQQKAEGEPCCTARGSAKVVDALRRVTATPLDPRRIRRHAEQFSSARHTARMRALIEETLAQPAWPRSRSNAPRRP